MPPAHGPRFPDAGLERRGEWSAAPTRTGCRRESPTNVRCENSWAGASSSTHAAIKRSTSCRTAWFYWVMAGEPRRPGRPQPSVSALEHDAVATAFAAWVCERRGASPSFSHEFATELAAGAAEHVGIALYARALNADEGGATLDAEQDLVRRPRRPRPEDPFVLCELTRPRADRGGPSAALVLYRRAGVVADDPDVQFLSTSAPAWRRSQRSVPVRLRPQVQTVLCTRSAAEAEARAAWLFQRWPVSPMTGLTTTRSLVWWWGPCDHDREDFSVKHRAFAQDPFIIDLCVFEGGHADAFVDTRGVPFPRRTRECSGIGGARPIGGCGRSTRCAAMRPICWRHHIRRCRRRFPTRGITHFA